MYEKKEDWTHVQSPLQSYVDTNLNDLSYGLYRTNASIAS